ncbi:hypothetical protein [Tolumonas auensis]|uniref:hypothetical protein n=1 Tax=Tolumonas auensis TaxID=43948 RepID=UPI002AA890F5|nr:hypothetical protein [Tolumonas auensis]
MIFNVSNGWLLNKIKYGINNHDEYILETLEAAKMLNVSVIELKDAILKSQSIRGWMPPDAYKVGSKYYFLFKDLIQLKTH